MRHDFADGKYTVIFDNGKMTALRNGEPWERSLIGDNLVYWMLAEVDRLKGALRWPPALDPSGVAEALRDQTTWISTKDRLPEPTLRKFPEATWRESKRVLVVIDRGPHEERYAALATITESVPGAPLEWIVEGHGGGSWNNRVTYWCEIAEIPSRTQR